MPDRGQVIEHLQRIESYLSRALLPFWMERSPDPEFGGFLSYFDADGRPTGETDKTLLMQVRMLFTFAGAHRDGYGGGRCAGLARTAADFIIDHYWDDARDGWFWIADRAGNPTCRDKVGYGHALALHAFSECALATGHARSREAADRTAAAIRDHMADTARGGYFELMGPDWAPAPSGPGGGDRKSFDVHMHMMEAWTNYYELTGEDRDRRELDAVIDILIDRMHHPARGLAWLQFSLDFEPLPAIIFDTQWGRDADPVDGKARPLDLTSYGHNVEFLWLLLHAADIRRRSRAEHAALARTILDHCLTYGIDHEFGGVFVEGPMTGPTTLTEKQFWQHPEAMIGLLDGCLLFAGDPLSERCWDGFCEVTDFAFEHFINFDAGGEWHERLDREGRIIDGALGHGWKINYHTVRGMIQSARRLKSML